MIIEHSLPSLSNGSIARPSSLPTRTYFEVGKRLREPQSKFKELNGESAEAYLEKARVLFEEMELEWDLAELERVLER